MHNFEVKTRLKTSKCSLSFIYIIIKMFLYFFFNLHLFFCYSSQRQYVYCDNLLLLSCMFLLIFILLTITNTWVPPGHVRIKKLNLEVKAVIEGTNFNANYIIGTGGSTGIMPRCTPLPSSLITSMQRTFYHQAPPLQPRSDTSRLLLIPEGQECLPDQ